MRARSRAYPDLDGSGLKEADSRLSLCDLLALQCVLTGLAIDEQVQSSRVVGEALARL